MEGSEERGDVPPGDVRCGPTCTPCRVAPGVGHGGCIFRRAPPEPILPIPDEALPADARLLTRHYELLDELGRGGMAVVYLARERATGESVAIKLVDGRHAGDDEAAQRFAREAETVARLRHPNLVRTLHVETLGGRAVAIVNAYVRGRTLRAVLRESGALRFEVAVAVLRDVAAGLAHAHAARIVHRDVKPENIFLEDGSDRALLADFGIARPLDGDTQLTIAGAAIGTPTYMAPEQVDGRPADPRADVYALGLVGWEMLSGRRPWQGESLYAVLHNQKHEQLDSLAVLRPDIPAFLLTAIEGALRKAPEERWADAGALLAQLMPRAAVLPPPSAASADEATTMRRVLPVAVVAAAAAPAPDAPVRDAPGRDASSAEQDRLAGATPTSGRQRRPPARRRRSVLLTAAAVVVLVVAVLGARVRGSTRPADVALDSLLTAAVAASRELIVPAGARRGPASARVGGSAAGDVRLAPVPDSSAAARRGTPPTTGAPTAAVPGSAPSPALAARCRSALAADQRSCLLGQLADSDARMSRVYGQLIGRYRRAAGGAREPRAVRALRTEQRGWVAARDRVCRARTRATEGPLWGAARVPCFVELSERRTAVLTRRLPR